MDRKDKIFELLLEASEKGFNQLFKEHNEHFYYCSIVMMDVATPCITAMSDEIYDRLLRDNAEHNHSTVENKIYYRWAYAESPYLGFGYDKFFKDVNDFFCKDVSYDLPDDKFEERVADWLIAMREVMKTLKDNGIFKNIGNENIFLFAEQQPPEKDVNIDNARYLNEDNMFELWYMDNKDEYKPESQAPDREKVT